MFTSSTGHGRRGFQPTLIHFGGIPDVGQVVAKRMVKKQQMQWSKIGAHCLLQTRTAVLNGELRGHFEDWYPEMNAEASAPDYIEPVKLAA